VTPEEDDALDLLGTILHTLGRVSFDVEDESQDAIRQTFERWAQHVLVGARATDAPDESGEHAGPKRDWAAVRRFVVSHRKREVAYVVKALGDLRNAVFAFTGAFSRVVGEDGKSDTVVKAQLARLEVAAKENNTTAITREALATVALVNDSIERRAQRHSAQLGELVAHVRQLNDQLERAKTAGSTDSLTRVPNRACFDEFLSRTVDLAALSSGAAYLMMVDVDHFKQTNDTLGHGAGDSALKAVADRLSRSFPRRGDLVARYGGDEFAVVLRDLRPDEARLLAERLVVAMRATTGEHLGKVVKVSVSVGLAPRREGDTALTWVARADAALYEAKQAGRDRWAERPD
jgi:diguanylate cyclase (GGDEF)-like protein